MNAITLLYQANKHYTKPERKTLRNWYKSTYGCSDQRSDSLAAKQKIRDAIDRNKINGIVFVEVDSTDCDHCRSTSIHKIPASVMAYEAFCNDRYEWAEGATYICIVSPTQAEQFKPSFRDYIAEAYEDGHAHVVYR